MYFRNDRKMVELKKVYQEKEKLLEKFNIAEEELHKSKMLNFDKSEELRDIKLKYELLKDDFDYIKKKFDNKQKTAILNAERPLKVKIAALEHSLHIEKSKYNSLQAQLESSTQSDEVLKILDNLSVMFLSRSSDTNFLTQEQQALVKSLFSDFATKKYKKEIEKLREEWAKLKHFKNYILLNSGRKKGGEIASFLNSPKNNSQIVSSPNSSNIVELNAVSRELDEEDLANQKLDMMESSSMVIWLTTNRFLY
jgi:hypothetical protein